MMQEYTFKVKTQVQLLLMFSYWSFYSDAQMTICFFALKESGSMTFQTGGSNDLEFAY